MKIQSFKDYIVEQEKNFLDETIGILYSPDNNLLFIGSNLDSSINFTIYDIYIEDEIAQLKDFLKSHNPNEWKYFLEKSGYKIDSGEKYFELTK